MGFEKHHTLPAKSFTTKRAVSLEIRYSDAFANYYSYRYFNHSPKRNPSLKPSRHYIFMTNHNLNRRLTPPNSGVIKGVTAHPSPKIPNSKELHNPKQMTPHPHLSSNKNLLFVIILYHQSINLESCA